jgi:hypothetical protein
MNHIDNEEKSRLPGWICVEDAKKRNAENEALYSEDEKQLADMFAQQTRNAYIRSRVYLNYREKFIAVKIDKPSVSDKISVVVDALHKDAEALGYTIVKTKSNIVFRLFPRK